MKDRQHATSKAWGVGTLASSFQAVLRSEPAACNDAGNMLASCGGDKHVRIWQRFEGNSGTGGASRWACTAMLEEGHSRTVRAHP